MTADDMVRERHGIMTSPEGSGNALQFFEADWTIVAVAFPTNRELCPEEARYLARKLYRLARRVEARCVERDARFDAGDRPGWGEQEKAA